MYPIFAVAYGSFGLGFGLYLWWRTQKRIERTSKGVSKQVGDAVIDIKSKVATELAGVTGSVKAEVRDIDAKITAQVAEVKRTVDSLPTIDPEALSIDYDELSAAVGPALMEQLGPSITEHVTMAVLQFKAQETKELQKLLEEAGLDGAVEQMGAEAQAAMLAQLNLGQRAAAKILSVEPSKKWIKEHPYGAMGLDVFKSSQLEVLAALQGQGRGHPGQGTIESVRFAPGEV